MNLQEKLPLLLWVAVATGIVVFTPLGKSIQAEFTTPEPTHTSNKKAMDACLEYATQQIDADLALPNPETYAEEKKRLDEKDYEYVKRSEYKNADGESMILDVYCEREVRTRLFGLIKWNSVVPKMNWVEKPTKECLEGKSWESLCFHKPHFEDLISAWDYDKRELIVFFYPYTK